MKIVLVGICSILVVRGLIGVGIRVWLPWRCWEFQMWSLTLSSLVSMDIFVVDDGEID
jgi:hypothetical protein